LQRCLFFALNDEVFRIRELAVMTLGRQAKRNPAYILPSLRKVLLKVSDPSAAHTIQIHSLTP